MRRLGKIIVATGLGFGLLCGVTGGVANADPATEVTNLLSKDSTKTTTGTKSGPENNNRQIADGGAGTGGLVNGLNEVLS